MTSTINPNIPVAGTLVSSQPIRDNFAAAYNDINALQNSSLQFVPYTGASQDTNLGSHNIAALNYVLPENGSLISADITGTGTSYIWPQLWPICNDQAGGAGGTGNPVCSLTLTNTSTINKFGELAFNKWPGKVGAPTDTWAFAVDPDRANVENFKLRHSGADILHFSADNSQVRVLTNLVLDGSVGKILQSYNSAGTQIVNMARLATVNSTPDYMVIGMSSANLAGVSLQSGTAGEAIRIPGSTAEAWFINRVGIGTGAQGGTAKLTVYGANGEGTNGQTIRLGISSSVDYRISRNNSDGNLEFAGSQAGAMGFKWLNTTAQIAYISEAGALAIGSASPAASAQLDIQSTTKGMLFPRMTTTQKNAIATPAEGLVVYDTTLHKLCVRTASAWETITSV